MAGEEKMKEERNMDGQRVGIGSILAPGTYQVEGELMMLRVRLKGTMIECLIDQERRVIEMLSRPAADDPLPAGLPAGKAEVAFDAGQAAQAAPCRGSEEDLRPYVEAAGHLTGRFEEIVQRYAADGRACLRKMAVVLDRRNRRPACELRENGAAGLKAYLIRELFKRTVREERGFKVLLLLAHAIAAGGGGQPERLEAMTLEQQKQLLREFMDFLKVAGHKRIDPRIFEDIYAKFSEQELVHLTRGGTGFFIKPLYMQEMEDMKRQLVNPGNANYIEQLFRNSHREPLDFLFENTLAYLKALAIVRLYARSNRKERGGDSRIVELVLGDLIRFRPSWVRVLGREAARSA
jgi:hypothetical protein